MRAIAVALELEHAVDEVLEHARAGDGAVLRHVADEEDGDAVLLRDAQEPRCGFAHLRHRAGGRAELRRVERLHRVDHADVRPLALERRADRLELGLGEHGDRLGAAEPGRAELHLRRRLLAGDEQRLPVGAHRAQRHQQQRRLADAGLAADQHERRGNEPAAEHAVELRHAGRDPLGFLRLDVDEAQQRPRPARRPSWRPAPTPRPASRTHRSPGTSRTSARTSTRIRGRKRRTPRLWPRSQSTNRS